MKPQTNLLRECARRTPIYQSNPIAEFVAALLMFAVIFLASFL